MESELKPFTIVSERYFWTRWAPRFDKQQRGETDEVQNKYEERQAALEQTFTAL